MIRTVICDLGKVLLDFDHMQPCREVERLCGKPSQDIYNMMFTSGLEKEYDLGRITSEAFGRKIRSLFGLEISLEEIRRIWQDIFRPVEGMENLIQALRGHYRLLLLSNTNEWHFDFCLREFPVVGCFDDHVLSFRLGCRKPEPAIYDHALKRAEAPPGECVYIDDIQAYVDAAQALGIHGLRFEGAARLKSSLRALGIRV